MKRPYLLHAALAALVLAAAPRPAAAKEFTPQNNEVSFDVDATFAKHGDNDADLSLVYTWLPGALDKNDEVVPLLRKYVRQPIEIGGKLTRNNDVTDSISGLHGFAQAWLAEIFYGRADVGFEYDNVINDPSKEESAFIAGNFRAEAGARVLPLLQLGAFYRYRPVLITLPEPNGIAGYTQERSGQTQEYGVSVGFATPEDRLLVTALAGFRQIDWTFTGVHYPGDVTGRAPFVQGRISLQLSPQLSFYLRGEWTNTDWDNERLGQAGVPNDMSVTHRPAQMTRLDVRGDLGVVYWFEGKWGFRVSLGGGYYNKGPLAFQDTESGLARLGIGFTTRY